MTTFRQKLVRGVVATAVVASTLAVGAPVFAAKAGDKCSLKDAYNIEKVGSQLRAMMPWISKGKKKVAEVSGG